jgi:hypothetical protein
MTICHRNPIHLAQCFAALSRITNGRVIMGMGLGGFPHEFAAAGLPSTTTERAYLAKINADLCRRLWAGERVSHKDSYYNFQDVELKPAPVSPIPVWRLDIGGLPACGGVWRRVAARANHRRNLYKASRISSGGFANGGTSHDYGGSDALDQHRQR